MTQTMYLERFSPARWTPPWVRHQHMTRYSWVSEFARGARVIDAACGTGYGSELIARFANPTLVDGFDVSTDAIAEATVKFGHVPGLSFRKADVVSLPVDDASYDLYVCFETVEHVTDDRALVAESRRVLDRNGMLVISTPNRDIVAPGTDLSHSPDNPSHVREYSVSEFVCLLSQYFSTIQLFGQSPYGTRYAEMLRLIGTISTRCALRVHQARKTCESAWRTETFHHPTGITLDRSPEILIAVCS